MSPGYHPLGEWSYWPASMYCLAPYFEHGERIVHARRGAGTVTDHVGAGGTRTCVRFDSGAARRFKSTHALGAARPARACRRRARSGGRLRA